MKNYLLIALLSITSALANTTEIVFLGDSLTAGYGIEKEKAYPQIVENKLKAKGKDIKVLNGGVSGSTTAGGKSRLGWFLKKSNPDIMVLALGANDGLRGLKLSQSEKNLEEIINIAKKKNIKVLLAGMRLPPNYGKDYVKQFRSMYKKLKEKHNLKMIPFMLKDVGGRKELNIEDGIHPNEKGHEVIANTVIKYLEPLL
ncbi:MAG: arylesterase [Halobacteriovoraceae bacterium]|nr:arylesterase [Halobacteriovoraceae bacterium]|tara:strand:- start:53260 stop:53859 length:600 start_codon:yes stop_codon:yes gene_type:complete